MNQTRLDITNSLEVLTVENTPAKKILPLELTLTQHALGLVVMIGGGAVLFAFLLDLVGLPLRPWLVGPLILLLIGAFGVNFLYQIKKGNYAKNGCDWSGFLLFALVVTSFLAYGLWLGWPTELPVGTTVDAVHQYGLASYINQSGRLPIHALDQRLNLQDGLEYPPAFVILVSLLSQSSGIDPVNLLHPVVTLMAAVGAGATFAIVNLLLHGKALRLPLAALAAGAIFLPYAYTFGSFISQTYYAQVTAEAFLMLSLFFLLNWQRQGDMPGFVLFGLTVAALFIAYPTLALIPLAAFGAATLFGKSSGIKLRVKNIAQSREAFFVKYTRFSTLAAIYIPVGVLAVLFLKDRLQTGLGTLANEGEVLSPDISRYGWPIVLLAAIGLGATLFTRNILFRVTVLFVGLLVLEGVGLWLLKILFNNGSYYAVYKMFYPAVYLLPVLAGIGLDWLLELVHLKIRFKWPLIVNFLVSVGIFGAFMATTWIAHPQPERTFAVITQDNVKVAHWMQNNLQVQEYNVGYNLVSGASAYWLQVGLFKQPRDVHSNDLLLGEPLTFDGWFYAPNSPQYLFTDNLPKLNLNERSQVLFRSGSSAILTRTSAYQQELLARPNLAIQYTMKLDKNILAFNAEATMSQEITNWLGVGLEITEATDERAVFTLAAPAEAGRAKKQTLGLIVSLPKLEVKELYSNNNYPPVPHPNAPLEAGRYSIFVVLQKQGVTAEKRKLLDFEIDAASHLNFDPAQHIIMGQFLFEGEIGQVLPALGPLDFKLAGSQLRLTGLNLPTQAVASSTITATSQWQNLVATSHNYRVQWFWLNPDGSVAGQLESLPQNGLYPTWLWSTSKPTTITQPLKIPAQPGRYQLAIALVDINTGEKSELLKTGQVITVSN